MAQTQIVVGLMFERQFLLGTHEVKNFVLECKRGQ